MHMVHWWVSDGLWRSSTDLHTHTHARIVVDTCDSVKLYFNDWSALFDSCNFGTLDVAFVHCFACKRLDVGQSTCVYDHRAQWISSQLIFRFTGCSPVFCLLRCKVEKSERTKYSICGVFLLFGFYCRSLFRFRLLLFLSVLLNGSTATTKFKL